MRIDPHVHFRDEEQSYKETISHGLSVARDQGVDYVFDMPNTFKPVLREADVQRRLNLVPPRDAGRYFLYVGATRNLEQLKEAVDLAKNVKEVIGLKCFAGKSTGDLAIVDEEKQKKIYSTLAENNYRGVLALHCEKESFMNGSFDPDDPVSHARARPGIAEVESIKDQVKFARETGFNGTLHICHVSCKASVELIDALRSEIKITCGVTPHHLLWDDRMLSGRHGLLYKTNPPLRSRDDVASLKKMLRRGKIDWIETDHAPHTVGEKLHDGYPSGYPSLYLYRQTVEKLLPDLGLSEEQIKDLTFNNIRNAFELDL
ncbi:MAG: dihydroorotase [Desulfobacterales bacterium]|nr:dihydroorotase [Desulfobacterales bacterium]